jgi:hypothetical protein
VEEAGALAVAEAVAGEAAGAAGAAVVVEEVVVEEEAVVRAAASRREGAAWASRAVLDATECRRRSRSRWSD